MRQRDEYNGLNGMESVDQAYAELRKPSGNRHERRMMDKIKRMVRVDMDSDQMETA